MFLVILPDAGAISTSAAFLLHYGLIFSAPKVAANVKPCIVIVIDIPFNRTP